MFKQMVCMEMKAELVRLGMTKSHEESGVEENFNHKNNNKKIRLVEYRCFI